MKKKLMVAAMTVALAVTGCGVTELSDENTDIIAEYMAGALLKHNKDYTDAIDYDKSVLTVTPTPVPTVKPATAKPTATVKPQNPGSTQEPMDDSDSDDSKELTKVSLSELYGKEGIKVKHTTYTTGKSYGSDYSSISAGSGKKLIVVYFNIKNKTSKNVKLNLAKKSVSYQLYKDDNAYGEPLLTIAKGDLQYFNEKIKAGRNRQGVLIFEVDSSFKVKGSVIKAVKDGKEADIVLK